MITVQGLDKRYGPIHAVRGATFEANDSQVTGLLGPNGAGKTTTLRMISSLVAPDSGSAHVDDDMIAIFPNGLPVARSKLRSSVTSVT